jgi:large subunit ribosomal protein L20
MPRVKRGPKRKNRRTKILKLAKGYYGMKSRGHRIAKQAVEKALVSAFAGRKDRKGDFRKLWIARINAAARLNGMSYSKLMAGLKLAGNTVDRKILADIAVRDAASFSAIVAGARAALDKQQLRDALDKETSAKRDAAKPKAAAKAKSTKETRAAKQAAAGSE